jgi:tetratricopeptide (TPR) repeat protein
MHSARFALAACLALLPGIAAAQTSALDAAKSAASASPTDPAASLGYGRALRRAGKYDEAVRELRRGLATPQGRAGEGAIALHWEIARVAIDRRDFGQAMVACKLVASQTGGAARGAACQAEAHLLWRRASEALTMVAQALAGGNKVYEAKVAEGRAYSLQLRDAEAEASFREAIAWQPEAWEAHYWLGKFLVDTGKTEAGITELRLAAQKDPNGPEVAYELGRALPPAEGIAHLERAVRERPGYTAALVRQADVLLALGRIADARKAADAAARTGLQDAGIHVALGRVALAEGKPDEALAASQKALSILANSAAAKLLAADAYAKKKEIDLAIEQYQAAYGLDRTDPDALVHASIACLENGRITSAKAFGDKATKEFPSWGPGWVALGDALAADKDVGGARAAYDNALKGKGPVDVAAVRAKIAKLR